MKGFLRRLKVLAFGPDKRCQNCAHLMPRAPWPDALDSLDWCVLRDTATTPRSTCEQHEAVTP